MKFLQMKFLQMKFSQNSTKNKRRGDQRRQQDRRNIGEGFLVEDDDSFDITNSAADAIAVRSVRRRASDKGRAYFYAAILTWIVALLYMTFRSH